MKSLNCPGGFLAFVPNFSKLLSCPWMLCVIHTFWLTQELWVILNGLKNVTSDGALVHVIWINLETEISHVHNQSIMSTQWNSNKTLGTEAWVNYSGCQYSEHIVTHKCRKSNVFSLQGERSMLEPSEIWPVNLTLAYLNLYPFLAINFSCGCNSFHWLLWVYLVS